MHRFSVVLAFVGVAAWGLGCGGGEDGAFEGSTPTKDTVALQVPGGGTATATGALTDGDVRKSALIGEKADAYKLTVAITDVVNGSTVAVLALVHAVIQYPATTVSGDMAVWGPYTEPLKANAWRLTVTKVAQHEFAWHLDGKPKASDDSAFVVVLSGMHTRALDAGGRLLHGFGSGNFSIDWDAAATLPDHDDNVGQASFTYSRIDPAAVTTIDVAFHGIKDKDRAGEIFDAVYHYAATPGAGGDLQYGANQDDYPGPGPTGTAKETLALHSRWKETGAGRSDVRVTGGDLATSPFGMVTSSECWDAGFGSVYKLVSYDPTQDWGAESSCAFPSADFVTLAP
jgi:hypothetical protein